MLPTVYFIHEIAYWNNMNTFYRVVTLLYSLLQRHQTVSSKNDLYQTVVAQVIVLSKFYSVYLISIFANTFCLPIATFDNINECGNTCSFAPQILIM